MGHHPQPTNQYVEMGYQGVEIWVELLVNFIRVYSVHPFSERNMEDAFRARTHARAAITKKKEIVSSGKIQVKKLSASKFSGDIR